MASLRLSLQAGMLAVHASGAPPALQERPGANSREGLVFDA